MSKVNEKALIYPIRALHLHRAGVSAVGELHRCSAPYHLTRDANIVAFLD